MSRRYATIWHADSPLAECSVCHMQQQFHDRTSEPHAFVASTISDYEPGDLTAADLTREIFAKPNTPRAVACGAELRDRVHASVGVSWDDLAEALA